MWKYGIVQALRLWVAAVAVMLVASSAWAQGGVRVEGRLLNGLSGDPVAGAIVTIEEMKRDAPSATDGAFSLDGVPPGDYHLVVRAQGYLTRRVELTVAAAAVTGLTVTVDPEMHFQEVLSVSPNARSQFEAFQPTSVLGGAELTRQVESSLGATLDQQPGVASRSLGPGPSRPVIRGLDGDRVLILQDGQRTGDLSSQSGDHGVTVNPASAQRIEVVRGPATLLYGANAIGGLVNVITDDIPTRRVRGTTGNFLFDLGSASREGGGAGAVQVGNGSVVLSLGGGGRHNGDYATPEGRVLNSQSRNGFGKVGLGWTGEKTYAGASYGYDDTKFGIPVVEGGVLQLTPRRQSLTAQAGGRNLGGVFDEFKATLAMRRYKHDELEGDDVGTAFKNNTTEASVLGSHKAIGRLKGSIGAWVMDRTFDAVGAEALSPKVNLRGTAAFLYEEVTWPHVTFQFGGRVDHTRFDPAGEVERTFTNASGSVGLLYRPAAANDRFTLAASLARAARNPALEELFFFGTHHGNFSVELGNPDLQSEHALGADLSLRWRGRVSGEITYFRNSISNFIYRDVIDEEIFEAREDAILARFPGRTLVGHAHDEAAEGEVHEDELPIVDFVSADATLQGVELHTDVQMTQRVIGEFGMDYVRGSVGDTGTALPRIPPLRVRGGLRYQGSAVQFGGQVLGSARQDRVSGLELPTDGWTTLRLFASYSFASGGTYSTITARFDNATNTLYRNHLSLIKEQVPELGRNFKLLYNVRF